MVAAQASGTLSLAFRSSGRKASRCKKRQSRVFTIVV